MLTNAKTLVQMPWTQRDDWQGEDSGEQLSAASVEGPQEPAKNTRAANTVGESSAHSANARPAFWMLRSWHALVVKLVPSSLLNLLETELPHGFRAHSRAQRNWVSG